jgi:RNA polymerase sigma-70 factor (ECF subfamily)
MIGIIKPNISDAALLQSIANGEKAALKLLYLRHRERLYRFVVQMSGSDSRADETVAEVFLAVWRNAGKFEGTSQVASWLLAIAQVKVLSEGRRRSEAPRAGRVPAPFEDPADGPAISVEKRPGSDTLQRCLRRLTSIHRDAINLMGGARVRHRTGWGACFKRLLRSHCTFMRELFRLTMRLTVWAGGDAYTSLLNLS